MIRRQAYELHPNKLGYLGKGLDLRQKLSADTVAQIKKCLDFIAEDVMFTFGDTVIRRLQGWPMGGSMSEPGTLIDLSEDLLAAHVDTDRLKELGWYFPKSRLFLNSF